MFICACGINHQYYKNSIELKSNIKDVKKEAVEQENCPRLIDKNYVNREDRSVLNEISIISVNSLNDLIDSFDEGLQTKIVELLSKASIFTASDGPDITGEIDHTKNIMNDPDCQEGSFWKNISNLGKFANPLDVLRLLTTNSLYHISKITKSHEEGFPIQTASISSLVALDMANSYAAICKGADFSIVSAASDMTNVEFKPFWMKINKIKTDENHDGIVPAWGGATLLLSKEKIGSFCLAEILASNILYKPKSVFLDEDWNALLSRIDALNIKPDVFVSYDNGVYEQGKSEREAIKSHFPNARIINYKSLLGYTGKSNTALDICCSLYDDNISSNEVICVNAAGLNYGLGFVILRKF